MLQALTYVFSTMIAALVTVVTAVLGSDTIPRALATLADTERAFAKQAADTTIRAAFLEYFADESVSFTPDPGPARDRLRKEPDAFPKDLRMTWEPRVGDIAASGDLGYLTGPVESAMPGQPLRHGNYFSVWKKQANGDYRVILDVGSSLPGKAEFALGFVRSPALAAYKGTDSKASAEAGLLAADTDFSAEISAKGAAAAYADTLHTAARVHRSGSQPMTNRDAAVTWMRDRVKTMTSRPMKSETAVSRDLGYTWGAFTMTPTAGSTARPRPDAPLGAGKEETGYYVRVWTRAADGKWMLAADVTQASP